ncbi:heme o synthase [Coraliomargarita sp. SDUM461004]|uniref:Protoheme IX farnesyltransferase n=1 Tax=Thalassobacterium sedimentorum TaxID=3041258 RepID=A0ABU1AHF1_9BACT|nr:heme o synthase [Coraliomargarita sp. SDUM461004]MDQ8194252.1 heme o synthase [Coraliomargarita sp. SDUM461004]
MSLPNTDTKSINSDTAFSLRSRVNGYYELTKPRLSFMSVITAIIGYLSADPQRDFGTLASLLIGTSLAAGGAAVLNQWLEREADAQMVRTKDRPIPSGQIAPYNALMFGMGLSIFGTYLLYAGANPLAGLITAATVASYVLLYTPLKKLTTWNTLIGAIPGALPPLIGWAAAEGKISTLGWILFAILFLWQMPHFFAIAWTYRKDYKQGGFIMLSNTDADGTIVARQAFVFAVALVLSTLLPTLLGYASWGYGSIAIIAGCYILRPAWTFLKAEIRDTAARRLFIASIFYLPALLIPLVLDLWLI